MVDHPSPLHYHAFVLPCSLRQPPARALIGLYARAPFLYLYHHFDKAPSLGIATIKKGEMVVPRHPIGIGLGRDKIWLRCSPWLRDDPLGINGAVPDPDPALSFANSSAMVAQISALTDSLTSPSDFFSAFSWFPSFSTGDFPFLPSFPQDVAEALASPSLDISHYNERQLNLHSCS